MSHFARSDKNLQRLLILIFNTQEYCFIKEKPSFTEYLHCFNTLSALLIKVLFFVF